jgi:DNA-binding transcriptional ArsR family regulator
LLRNLSTIHSNHFEQEEAMRALKTRKPIRSSIVAVASHPLRGRCLTILNERVASPKELAEALGEPDVSRVAYHVKVLREMGKIELVDTAQRRGATEHFYRGVEILYLTAEQLEELSLEERENFVESITQDIVSDLDAAFSAGTIATRPEMCLNRYMVRVDEEGFRELSEILVDAQEKAFDVQARSDNRVSNGSEVATMPARFLCGLFEMPEPTK